MLAAHGVRLCTLLNKLSTARTPASCTVLPAAVLAIASTSGPAAAPQLPPWVDALASASA